MIRVLLGQLGSNGDCLYATTVARQVKHDFPGCHLTWAISSLCRPVIENNPHVDDIWEIPAGEWQQIFGEGWYRFETEAWNRVEKGEFDMAFMTQIAPSNFANYDGTIRPSIFRSYPKPITVPVETVIQLTDEKKEAVDEWIKKSGLSSYEKVVLFECASKSGQSFVTPEYAVAIAKRVIAERPDTCFVLSTHLPIQLDDARLIHGGALGLRETAYLSHYADLFVGCGSGVTVSVTSATAKPNLPNIQILNAKSSVYASFRHDFEYFGKPSGHFLETTAADVEKVAKAIVMTLEKGIETAKAEYDERIAVTFNWYFEIIRANVLAHQRHADAAHSLMVTVQRYGPHPDLLNFGRREILPRMKEIRQYLAENEPDIFSQQNEDFEAFQALLSTGNP
jgi:hypothetical protein